RKASTLNLHYSFSSDPSKEWMLDFTSFFNRLAKRKGIAPANVVRMKALRAGGALDMSKICDGDGRTLVWHVYIRTSLAVRLLYSASLFREQAYAGDAQLIGKANRYQHWLDMLRLREAGVVRYDFGGFDVATDDEDRLRISRFKAGFGGEVVRRFNADHPITWPGTVLLGLKKASRIQRAIDLLKFRYSQ
ncbi:MAG: aminoacyltransferase, partial [Acidobacteriota bacterium]|nr:aminoacyltransferase [Acidobacteriota bacterium]